MHLKVNLDRFVTCIRMNFSEKTCIFQNITQMIQLPGLLMQKKCYCLVGRHAHHEAVRLRPVTLRPQKSKCDDPGDIESLE